SSGQPIAGGEAVAEVEDYRNTRRRRRGNGHLSYSKNGENEPCNAGPRLASASHRVEKRCDRAISSRLSPPEARFQEKMTTSLHSGGLLVVLDDVRLTLGSAAGPVNILRGISLDIGIGEKVSLV